MNDLAALAYTSTATHRLFAYELDELLINARAYNEQVQVTGALFHHNGKFFQYLEGPPAALASVYARIKRASQHTDMIELVNQPIDATHFAKWHMAFCDTPVTVLEQLGNERWERTLIELNQQQTRSPGLTFLLNFWHSAEGRPSSPF